MKIKRFSEWRLGDNFRQLSIVILGIVVTFMASDALSEYSKSRELKKAMQLVREELRLNRENVRKIADWVKMNQYVGRMMLSAGKNLEGIPDDTLQKYVNIPFQTEDFLYTNHALELLKTSSLFQQMRDKEHALQLIRAYAELELVARTMDFFMTEKIKRMEEHGAAVKERTGNGYSTAGKENSMRELWISNLSYTEFQNIFYFMLGCFEDTDGYFREVDEKLAATMEMIDGKYGTAE